MRWPILFQLRPLDIGPADVRRIALILGIFLVVALGLLTALVFQKQEVGPQGERGERGELGPVGPVGSPGLTGAAGQSAHIRFIDGECRQACNIACEAGERIISTFAMGLGTAITVAAIATLAVGAKGVAKRFASDRVGYGSLFVRGVEVGGAALVLLVGVLLLTGYMASERLFVF